jgi:hypothetical protein
MYEQGKWASFIKTHLLHGNKIGGFFYRKDLIKKMKGMTGRDDYMAEQYLTVALRRLRESGHIELVSRGTYKWLYKW